MARPAVRCDANTCAYNLPGNLCGAGRIEVGAPGVGGPGGDGGVPTGDGDTACETYRYRRGLGDRLSALANLNWAGLAVEPFRPGVRAAPEVGCRVENCLHWREGSCGAESVQVSGDAATLPDETNCSTFVPREF